MKRNDWTRICGVVLISVMAASTAFGGNEERGGGGKGRGEIRRFRHEQKGTRMEHFEAQMEENRQFHETLKGKQPNDACLDIINHRTVQSGENSALMDGQHEAFVTFVADLMDEHEVPDDKQAERLAEMEERYQEIKSRHQERHNAAMDKLQELGGNDDLTWEELKAAMKEFRPPHGRRKGRDGEGCDRPGGGRRNRGEEGAVEDA